jgi:uncharacterized protein YoaH (UPF0181 family)
MVEKRLQKLTAAGTASGQEIAILEQPIFGISRALRCTFHAPEKLENLSVIESESGVHLVSIGSESWGKLGKLNLS